MLIKIIMKKEQSKFKKFLNIVGDALTPSPMEDGAWGKGTMISSSFPGAKKLLIPAYLTIGLAAIPIAATYFLGKKGYKKLMHNYMEFKEMKTFFPIAYLSGEDEKFNRELSKIPFSGNEKTYNYLISTISDFSNELNSNNAKKFLKHIVENGNFTKGNYSDFLKNTLKILSVEGNTKLMDYLFKSEDIKNAAKERGFSYIINKEALIEHIVNYKYSIKNSPLPYLKALSEDDLKLTINFEPQRKPKM